MADSADSTPAPAIQPAPQTVHIFTHAGMEPRPNPLTGVHGFSPETVDVIFGDFLPPFANDPRRWRQRAGELLEWMLERQLELIAVFDLLDGDVDLEPTLGAPEVVAPLGWGQFTSATRQDHWPEGVTDSREVEDEHGGDILDEPHDERLMDQEPDHEGGSSWREAIDQTTLEVAL